MHLKAVRTLRTEAAISEHRGGYSHIDNPPEEIQIYIELSRVEATHLPPRTEGNDALRAALHAQLGADKYSHVSGSKLPEIMLCYRVLDRRPFGKTDPDDIAGIVLAKLAYAIRPTVHAAA
jgi:hypothetical protein